MGDFPFGLGSFPVPGPTFSVMSYGADPTGVKDSTGAFATAYNKAAATLQAPNIPGAYVTIPAGAFRAQGGNCVAADPRIHLIGAGSNICQVNQFGSGDMFYHHDPNFPTGSNSGNIGPNISGITIDGQNATGAAYGFHQEDICSTYYSDVQFQNYSGANQGGWRGTGGAAGGWSERLVFLKARTNNCTIGWNFDGTTDPFGGTSFDYMRMLDCYSRILPGQTGMMLQGFAQLDQGTIFYSYNMVAQASGANSTALIIGPTDPSTETSRIINSLFDIRGEMDGSGSTCTDLHIGTWAQFTGTGVLVNTGPMTAGAINSGSVYIAGYISTPAFPPANLLFSTPGPGSIPSFAAYTGRFPLPPAGKGMQLIDWTGSATRSTLIGGSGNPNGSGYFSNLAGDIFVRQDGANAPNSQLYVTNANGSNVWQPVVAAAIASGTVTLVAGSSGAIANANITANSVIRTFNRAAAGTVGALSVTLVAGVSFTIHSTSGTDTSSVGWEVVSY